MLTNRIFIILFALFVGIQSLAGQDVKWDITNYIGVNNFQYLRQVNGINNIAELRSEHKFQVRYKTSLTGKLSARGMYNYVNTERSRLFVNEAYVAINKGSFNSRIGKQVIKYGKLTGVSNLDLANTYDYFDFLSTDNEELGQLGLSSKVDLQKVQVEFNFVYQGNPSNTYFTDNAWVKLPQSISHPYESDVLLPVRLGDIIQSYSDHRINTFNLGISLELLGVNTRLDYYNGLNDIPFRNINLNLEVPTLPLNYDLELTIQPLSIYNLSFQKLFGDWNAWFEYGFIKNRYDNGDGLVYSDNYNLLSIGADRLILFEDPAKLLKLVGQLRYAIWNNKFDYQATDLDHVLDRAFILNINYQHTYKLSLGMRSVVSYDKFGLYVSPSVNYKLSDKLSITSTYDWLGGSDSHFFGHYTANDRFTFTLKFQL